MTDDVTTLTAPPRHDPGTYRRLPQRTRPVDPGRRRAAARRRVGAVHVVVGGVRRTQRARQQVAAARGHQLVPALGAVPDLDRLGPRRVAHRRRRQPAARPVDGLRRDARRPPQPARRRAGHRGPHRHRHPLRHPLAAGDRDERAVLRAVPARHAPLHQLRHRVADVRHPLRPGLHRPQGDHQDRGRLPRRLRRAPGVGQARARRDRPGRRARARRCPSTSRRARSTSSPTTTSGSSTGCSPSTAARSRRSSSSRSSRTCRSSSPTRATSPACARRATRTASS